MFSHPVVILEGLPGAGKTSLLSLLSHEFFCVPESLPHFGSGITGEEDYLRHDFEKLRLARASGHVALIDRGYASTLAWSHARLLVDGALEYYDLLGYVAKYLQHNYCQPDIYILIDVDPEISLTRKNRPVIKEDIWTQARYLTASHRFYEHYFEAVEPQVPCHRIGSDESLAAIAKMILQIVNDFQNGHA